MRLLFLILNLIPIYSLNISDYLVNNYCLQATTNIFYPLGTRKPCDTLYFYPSNSPTDNECICQKNGWYTTNMEGYNQPVYNLINLPQYVNNVGQTQLLCQLVKAIDCWQNNIVTNIGSTQISLSKQIIEPNYGYILYSSKENDDYGEISVLNSKGQISENALKSYINLICNSNQDSYLNLLDILPTILDSLKSPYNNIGEGVDWVLPTIIGNLVNGDSQPKLNPFYFLNTTKKNGLLVKPFGI